MDVLMTKDGKTYNIRNDSDFAAMLAECLGTDAAVRNEARIARAQTQADELRPMYPDNISRKSRHGGIIYDLTKIAEIGTDNLVEIATIAYEIPGWDE